MRKEKKERRREKKTRNESSKFMGFIYLRLVNNT